MFLSPVSEINKVSVLLYGRASYKHMFIYIDVFVNTFLAVNRDNIQNRSCIHIVDKGHHLFNQNHVYLI